MLLGAALLLSGCSLLPSKDKEADAMGIDTSGPPAFTLEVEAPKDMRELLEKHLELKRCRYQPDLQRQKGDLRQDGIGQHIMGENAPIPEALEPGVADEFFFLERRRLRIGRQVRGKVP